MSVVVKDGTNEQREDGGRLGDNMLLLSYMLAGISEGYGETIHRPLDRIARLSTTRAFTRGHSSALSKGERATQCMIGALTNHCSGFLCSPEVAELIPYCFLQHIVAIQNEGALF